MCFYFVERIKLIDHFASSQPTVGVTRWWAGRDEADLTDNSLA
jgi:hypothetical protein